MPKLSLSDPKLRSIPTPPKGQLDYWDTTLKGFGIRVSQGGSKTFVLNLDNSRRALGRYGVITLAEARREAKKLLAERTLGKARPQALTFMEAREQFLAEKTKCRRPNTVTNLKSRLEQHFPLRTQLAEITHQEIARRLSKIPTNAEHDHALSVVKTFFTWAHNRRLVDDNPTRGLFPYGHVSRARVLSDVELQLIWRACECNPRESGPALPHHFATIVKLLILTGQRRGEIAALRADYFDLGKPTEKASQNLGACHQCTITLPPTLTKNGREHTFPIGMFCAEILSRMLTTTPPTNGFIFSARTNAGGHFSGWSKSKALLDELSGVTDWTLHDLRRTFATRLAEMGTPIHVVEKLLNHISGVTGGLVAIYQRTQYWDEQVKAVTAWNNRLEALLKN